MTVTNPVILLTGRPGVGKSTVIKKIVSRLGGNSGGFYTRELRVGGRRTGFEIVTLAQYIQICSSWTTVQRPKRGLSHGEASHWSAPSLKIGSTVAGQTGYLATKVPDITLAHSVPFGKYRVNLEAIASIAVPALRQAMRQDQVIVIDEIGPMEILSKPFCQAVREILDSQALVLGTIVQRPNPFADWVKVHPRVKVKPVTLANRAQMPEQIYAELARYL